MAEVCIHVHIQRYMYICIYAYACMYVYRDTCIVLWGGYD